MIKAGRVYGSQCRTDASLSRARTSQSIHTHYRRSSLFSIQKYRIFAENTDTVVEDNGSADGIMSMAASLIERAEEVVNSGVVDESFRETFVPELKAEIASLEKRAKSAELTVTALEENLKSVKEQFVRLSADFDNFRKRSAAERDTLKTSVKGDTMAAMLPLIDNFELAKSQLKLETEGEQKIDAAYQGLYKQMVELFRGLGLEAVPGAGEPFDPELHEAIMREPSDEVPDGTVLEEFRKGFKLGDRLLRPAMVKVSYNDGESSTRSQDSAETPASDSSEENSNIDNN